MMPANKGKQPFAPTVLVKNRISGLFGVFSWVRETWFLGLLYVLIRDFLWVKNRVSGNGAIHTVRFAIAFLKKRVSL
jgi:hypothetical protein